MKDTPRTVSAEAFRSARDLVLDIFAAWRGPRDAVDALILLAITRSNVDGLVYRRDTRARFGGANPVAPDHLRQQVSLEILAQSVRLPIGVVRRRVQALAANDACVITPMGMLITERQIENSDRLRIVYDVYALLRRSYEDLKRVGFFQWVPVPPLAPAGASPPFRAAAGHGAKYVLRVLGGMAYHLGDYADAVIALHLLRSDGGQSPAQTAAALGMPVANVERRFARLLSGQVFERIGRDVIICRPDAAWLEDVEVRNLDYMYQLFAGLAEFGALDDFERLSAEAVRQGSSGDPGAAKAVRGGSGAHGAGR